MESNRKSELVTVLGHLGILGIILAALVGMQAHGQQQQQVLSMTTAAPVPVQQASGMYTGQPFSGSPAVCYFIVTTYPVGSTSPFGPVCVANSPGINGLSASRFITISWQAVAGATSYSVIRSATSAYPVPCSDCMVGNALTATVLQDTGLSGVAFPPVEFVTTAPATATMRVENQSLPTPTVQMSVNGGAPASVPSISGSTTTGNCAQFGSGGTLVDSGAACGGGGGGGDVTGPASSVSGNITTFNGLTGKIIQDSGKALPTGNVVGTGQANTFTTGAQDFSTATSFDLKRGAGYTPTAIGHVGIDTTSFRLKFGTGGGTVTQANQGAAATSGRCAEYDANGALTAGSAACGTGTVTGSSLTANLPVIGAGGSAVAVGTRSGNTTQYVTTTGAQTASRCVEIDASGNHIAAAAACASGGGSSSGNYITQNGTDYFGGDLFAVTRPSAAGSFAWTNQGTATLDTTTGAFSFFFPKTSGNNVRMYLQSTPSAPYTYKFAMKSFQIFSNNQRCGVGWRESATDKISGVVFSRGDTLKVSRWATKTSVPTDTWSNTVNALTMGLWWITLSRSGSTLTYSVGVDAVTLFTMVSEAMTGPFTTAPDQIGVICDNDTGGNWDNLLTIFAVNIS
jgi:hypothetical protein